MMQLQDREERHRKDWGRQSAYFGMFLALSLIFSYLETLIPISFWDTGDQAWTGECCDSGSTLYAGTKEALVLAILGISCQAFCLGICLQFFTALPEVFPVFSLCIF